ncbi:MAG: SMI1/KNR4 family protein [Limisphaerales bacterium]
MFELCKSKNWISTGEKPVRDLDRYVDLRHALELHRHIYFSVRLVLLLKELRIRSTVYQSIACKEKPTPSDELWVRDQLKRLSDEPADTPQTSHEPWFQDYLAKHRKTKKKAENGTLDRLGQRVPDSYKRFASSIGSKTYRNIDGQEGTNVRILSPQDVDFATFKGRIKDDLDQEAGADGIVFAVTDFGDQFCFKPLAGTFEVYRYDHEMDDFEPYAASFESCIRAWVEKPPK